MFECGRHPTRPGFAQEIERFAKQVASFVELVHRHRVRGEIADDQRERRGSKVYERFARGAGSGSGSLHVPDGEFEFTDVDERARMGFAAGPLASRDLAKALPRHFGVAALKIRDGPVA
jgi:hypothetical protein